jgi:hypothetical protein
MIGDFAVGMENEDDRSMGGSKYWGLLQKKARGDDACQFETMT